MHSGTTVNAFRPSDLKNLDAFQMSSMQTLLFSEEDGTMHMYRVASVSSLPDGESEVVAMSGEEFVVSAEGTIQVINNGSSSGGRRLLQEDSSILQDVVMLGVSLLSTPDGSTESDVGSTGNRKPTCAPDFCSSDADCTCGGTASGACLDGACIEVTGLPVQPLMYDLCCKK
jgi:hypothetical protein